MRVGVRTVVAACAALAASAAVAHVPAGPEVKVAYSSDFATARMPSRDVMGVFRRREGPNIVTVYAQRFDPTGAPVGPEINVASSENVEPPRVGAAADGSFTVAWMSWIWGVGSYDIWGRHFDAAGQATGAPYRISATSDNLMVDIATDPAGPSLVVYRTYNTLGDPDLVIGGRVLDAYGAPVGAEFRVNSWTTSWQERPVVAALGNGEFVAAWQDKVQDGSSYGVYAQRFAASGAKLGAEFRVNVTTASSQQRAAIAADASGNFVVAWESYLQDNSGFAAVARRFDPQGHPLTGELVANSYAWGHQQGVRVASAPDGDFVVIWESMSQEHLGGTYGQRFAASGERLGGEFHVNTYVQGFQIPQAVVADSRENFKAYWYSTPYGVDGVGLYMQRFGGLVPTGLRVDTAGNGVLEPGETADVRPSWRNVTGAPLTFEGSLATMDPSLMTVTAPNATYPLVADGSAVECDACYEVAVPNPPARPALHWDGPVRETIVTVGQGQRDEKRLHVGRSFSDVPTTNPFYRFVETLLHRGVTGGCGGGTYCPASSTTREQMAVFVLVAKEGTAYFPPACTTPVFGDVPVSNPFCSWIEELARRGVVGGCGGGNYCPSASVSRDQMAVFVLRTLEPALNPPACAPPNLFADVPETSPFCRWVEELATRGIVTGCGGGNYCPASPVTREQMGVFISGTFGLTLYGP